MCDKSIGDGRNINHAIFLYYLWKIMDGSNNEWEGDRDRNEISGLYRKARRSKEPSNNGRGGGGEGVGGGASRHVQTAQLFPKFTA